MHKAQAQEHTISHKIELEHNYWTCRRKITVDGRVLGREDLISYSIYGLYSADLFFLDGHICIIQARVSGLSYSYTCSLDGISVDTGKQVTVPLELLLTKPGRGDALPRWVLPFFPLALIWSSIGNVLGLYINSLIISLPVSTYAATPQLPADISALAAFTFHVSLLILPPVCMCILSCVVIIIVGKQSYLDVGTRISLCLRMVAMTGMISMALTVPCAAVDVMFYRGMP